MKNTGNLYIYLDSKEVEAKALSKMLSYVSGVVENNSKKSFATIKTRNNGSIGFDVSIHEETKGALLKYDGANILYGIIQNIKDKKYDELINFKSKFLKTKIVRFVESLLMLDSIIRCDKKDNPTIIIDQQLISKAFEKVSHIIHKEERLEIIKGVISGFNINTRKQEIFVISKKKTTKITINQNIHRILASKGCEVNYPITIEVLKKEDSNTAKAIRLIVSETPLI